MRTQRFPWPRRNPPRSVIPGSGAFNPLDRFRDRFTLAGSVVLDRCPVCGGADIGLIWQLPQTRLNAVTHLDSPGSAYDNFYLDYLPMLTVPQQIFAFDICADCHSVFRNPKDDDQAGYRNDTSKVADFKANGVAPFAGMAKRCERHFPQDTKTVIDAACGSGQILAILHAKFPALKLIGLELSRPSVEHIRSLGIAAEAVDLDTDDLDEAVPPGSADFIVFYEAFEHVRRPVTVLKKLVRMLRKGGRLHFSAQYYGPESSLQVRVGEPIYLDRHGLDWVLSQLDVDPIDVAADVKFRVTVQRR